jgi:hypothetical protein
MAAGKRDIPVLVYAAATSVMDRATAFLFPLYRWGTKLRR